MSLPALNKNDVNVFLLKDGGARDLALEAFYYDSITVEEKRKYHKFHFDKDKRLYLLSHAMLRLLLSHYIGCSSHDISFAYNAYGKPYLLDYPEISFNLSHSRQAIALVLNQGNNLYLGIDVESHQRQGKVIDLALNFFSPKECKLLTKYPIDIQDKIFFKFWTLKESYIKAIGKGLSIDLNSFAFSSLEKNIDIIHCDSEEEKKYWQFYQSEIYQDYFLALAIRSSQDMVNKLNIQTFEYLPTVNCIEKPMTYITSA